jgi:hypothetical protein
MMLCSLGITIRAVCPQTITLGLLPNHVYLTDDDDEYSLMDDDGQYYRRDVGMYNLEDSSVIEIVSPQPWLQLANSRMDNTKFYQDQ